MNRVHLKLPKVILAVVAALLVLTVLIFRGSPYHLIEVLPSMNVQQNVYTETDNVGIVPLSTNYTKDELPSEVQSLTVKPVKQADVDGETLNLPKSSYEGVDMDAYNAVLDQYSSEDLWITMALADQGCVDMAINFYETSLQRYGLTNYLIIGSDQKTCDVLKNHQINCYVYIEDKDAGKASIYHSKDFLRKMNIRTFMILDALNLGYNVLHTDVDIYYMQNPLQKFGYKSKKYDLAPLRDGKTSHNAGYLFIRSTQPSIEVYKASCHIAKTEPKTDDQAALNRAISSTQKKMKLAVKTLSPKEFQCGLTYWQTGHRNFIEDQACKECVVVHNNWIVSMEAKRYRFREIGMWTVDIDGYYSNPDAKYLTFDNEVTLNAAVEEDIAALKNAFAIGQILKRSVILPRFHCSGTKRCTIMHHLKIRHIEKYFSYRENGFLQNPKVPTSVKKYLSPIAVISTETYVEVSKMDPRGESTNLTYYQPDNVAKGATSQEILNWFSASKESVLRFDNLFGAFAGFSDKKSQKDFDDKIKNAFVKGNWKQM